MTDLNKDDMKQAAYSVGVVACVVGILAWVWGVFVTIGKHIVGDKE